jgi:anti-sigma regulatory factor (Ser/Thr protein kinase)
VREEGCVAKGAEGIDDHHHAVQPLTLQVPARLAALAGVRRCLTEWLDAIARDDAVLDGRTRHDIVLAVHEAAANAAEHAYAGLPDGSLADATFDVACSWDGSRLRVAVEDAGTWRVPGAPGDRGRGLSLIRSLAHDVDLDPSAQGTSVLMGWRLRAVPPLGG